MAKKSFKGANPAMQFINAAIEDTAYTQDTAVIQDTGATEETAAIKETAAIRETAPEPIVTPPVRTVQAPRVVAAPKVVKEPPVDTDEPAAPIAPIVSYPAVKTEAFTAPDVVTREAAQARRTADERKSKRLNLLIQPSIMEDLSKVSHMKQKSVNDLINIVLREYCGNKRELIEKYDAIFGE